MKRTILVTTTLLFSAFCALAQPEIVKDVYYGLYDKSIQKWVVYPQFESISKIKNYDPEWNVSYACRRNGKFAIYTDEGRSHFAFDGIESTQYGPFFIVKQDKRWGVIRADELIVFPFECSSISVDTKGTFTLYYPDHHHISYSYSEMVAATKSASAKVKFDEKLELEIDNAVNLPVIPKGVGYEKPKEVASTKYIEVSDLSSLQMGDCSNGYFMFRDTKTYQTYIFDNKGNQVGQIKTREIICPFDSSPVAIVKLEDYSLAIIRPDASIVATFKDINISKFTDGIALVEEIHNFPTRYFINSKGEHIFKHLDKMMEGSTHLEGLAILIDRTVYIENISENKRRFSASLGESGIRKSGYMDVAGNIVIPATFANAKDFHDGLAAVSIQKDGQVLWGFIDETGSFAIEPKFSIEPSDFCEGYAVVRKKDGTYCYIDKLGNIRAEGFKLASPFFKGYAMVEKKDQCKLPYLMNADFSIVANTHLIYQAPQNNKRDYIEVYGNLYNPVGECILSTSKISANPYTKFEDGVSKYNEAKIGKGYINDKNEWIIIFKEAEF